MTIRMQHLTVAPEAWNTYLTVPVGGTDSLNDLSMRFDLLSIVRHIMRERGDCDIIPVVVAFVTHPVNEWGHNAQVEVTYSTRGYRAIYGARVGGTVTNVQCYMD